MRKRTPKRSPPCLHSAFCIHHSAFHLPGDSMVIYPSPSSPHRPRARKRSAAGLWLVTAAFDSTLIRLDLTFDRPVNIAAMDVTKLIVDDSDNGIRFHGSGTPTLVSPAHVRVTMTVVAPILTPPVTLLTAGTPTG